MTALGIAGVAGFVIALGITGTCGTLLFRKARHEPLPDDTDPYLVSLADLARSGFVVIPVIHNGGNSR